MNKKAILAKLADIESTIKEIRDMLDEAPAASKGGEGGASGEAAGDDDKGGDSARIACPKCGSLKIIKHIDKGKVLYYHQGAPIYAKKGICSQCSAEMPL